MKNKENQQFKSSGLLLVLALVGLSVFVALTPWDSASRLGKKGTAKQKAEVVGYQILQNYRSTIAHTVSPIEAQARGIASASTPVEDVFKKEGVIGLDPWGQPYSYKVHESIKGPKRSLLIVWSKGENGVDDSHSELYSASNVSERTRFINDDIGVIMPIQD